MRWAYVSMGECDCGRPDVRLYAPRPEGVRTVTPCRGALCERCIRFRDNTAVLPMDNGAHLERAAALRQGKVSG
jgi:hypothetical protein